jgi:hypothetical protein
MRTRELPGWARGAAGDNHPSGSPESPKGRWAERLGGREAVEIFGQVRGRASIRVLLSRGLVGESTLCLCSGGPDEVGGIPITLNCLSCPRL